MKEELKRKENETKLQYFKRITDNRKELDIDYSEWSSAILGEERYGSENSRKMFYMVEKLLKQIDEEQVSSISDNEILKEIEEKTKELEIMKIQYQDQKREYRNYLRMDSRWQHIIDEMKIEIGKLNNYRPLNSCKIISESQTEATLMLSDFHLGMINDTKHNVYNLEIAKERLQKLYDKTILRCKLHKVGTLHIEILGDMLHGLIHLGTRINAEEDVISQTMLVSEMLSDFVYKLSNEINTINVYGTLGNHSRVSANVKDSISVENFERMITWFMKSRLYSCGNVYIYDNFDEDIIIYKAFNLNIVAVHGHKEKYKQAITDLSKFNKVFYDELHMGHYHSSANFQDNDMETIVNGTFGGTDEYASDHRLHSIPSQTLIVYNKEGQECIYKIKLKER